MILGAKGKAALADTTVVSLRSQQSEPSSFFPPSCLPRGAYLGHRNLSPQPHQTLPKGAPEKKVLSICHAAVVLSNGFLLTDSMSPDLLQYNTYCCIAVMQSLCVGKSLTDISNKENNQKVVEPNNEIFEYSNFSQTQSLGHAHATWKPSI